MSKLFPNHFLLHNKPLCSIPYMGKVSSCTQGLTLKVEALYYFMEQ